MNKNKITGQPAARPVVLPYLAVTFLVGGLAVSLLSAQFTESTDPNREPTLSDLSQRATLLAQVTNLIQRDSYCVPLSAYGRALDRALPKDARIFFSGMIGKDNGSRGGYYFILRNYLFPRVMDISLDGKVICHEGWFEGIPCDSPDVLRTNGYDLLLLLPPNSNRDPDCSTHAKRSAEMKEWLAFLLPPATAFAGMRLTRLLGGQRFEEKFGIGLRFAIGLAVGMLVFSQAALFGALAGINLTGGLAWLALAWGAVEVVLLLPKAAAGLKETKFRPAYLWLLLLLPAIWSWWVFGRLSTLEGTLEFDANVFWVFKSKVLYLAQGQNLLHWMHDTELAYAHWDYPLLVTCLYTLDYGLMGQVDEFVNKVWPFWMFVGLCLGLLSVGKVWKQPRPLPIVTVLAFGFLPATLHFVRQEGAPCQ